MPVSLKIPVARTCQGQSGYASRDNRFGLVVPLQWANSALSHQILDSLLSPSHQTDPSWILSSISRRMEEGITILDTLSRMLFTTDSSPLLDQFHSIV